MAKRFIKHHVKSLRLAMTGSPGAMAGKGGTAAVRAPDKRPEEPREIGQREIGGPEGPEPTRFGDWERKGICVDF